MNIDQTKSIIKKSALETSDDFTDNLMAKIEAIGTEQSPSVFPSIKKATVTIAILMLAMCCILFFTNFSNFSNVEIIGDMHRTKLFGVLLFSVLLGVNHLLKMKYFSENPFHK